MVPVTPSFPLFKLPYLAWMNVLETMEVFDLIKSSLCSRRFHHHIRSLFSGCGVLKVHFDEDSRIHIRFPLNIHYQVCPSNQTLQRPSSLIFKNDRIRVDFDLRDWINHLMGTFNCDSIGLQFSCARYDIADVQRVVEGKKINAVCLDFDLTNSYCVKALEAFKPTDSLLLCQRPNSKQPFLCDIISKHYRFICLLFPLTLEEVLTLNSKFISLLTMSPIDFNTLLRKWIDGWNPELVQLHTDVTVDYGSHRSVIFTGLTYQEFPAKTNTSSNERSYQIKRTDGTTATLTIEATERVASVDARLKV